MALELSDVLPSMFLASDKNDPRVNAQLRQKMAWAMLAQKRAFPKTLGEGLSAIGDAIGDRSQMRQLMDADLAQQQGALVDPRSVATGAPAATAGAPALSGEQSAAPASGGDAVIAGAGPEEGGYNAIDAQAGGRFKPTPGYLQDAIAAREPNPDMQAYYGSLSSSEAPKGAGDVSPTGAAGPYQFTRGTGASYGVPGDARADPGASTDAVRAFTADNAAKFTAASGRPPTYQELALMHQQGAQGGIDLLAGRPAPENNLAVNNMAGASPPQAVAKVNSFYGMPNETAPVSSRDAIARQLQARQAAGGPPPNPTLAGPAASGQAPMPSGQEPAGSPPDQRLAFNAPQDARGAVTDIRPAPPMPSTLIRPPAPTQIAQAQQQYPAGYVPPEQGEVARPQQVPLSPQGQSYAAWLAARQGNPYARSGPIGQAYDIEVQKQALEQKAINDAYEKQLATREAIRLKRVDSQIDQAKRIAEEAHVRAQTRREGIIENPEEKYIMGPDGVVRPIKVEGEDPNAPPGGKLSENEQKTLIYHGWAKLGNQAITGNDKLLAHGLAQEALGKLPVWGNQLQDAEYRRAKNGADNFILSFMRSTSGAAYGVVERLDHAKAMLPKLGDDDKTLADKAAQRQQFIDTEYAGLGKQAQKKADYIAKNYDPESAAGRQRQVDIEMQGIKGGIPGEVKTNRKTGEQRMWNGSRWVEAR